MGEPQRRMTDLCTCGATRDDHQDGQAPFEGCPRWFPVGSPDWAVPEQADPQVCVQLVATPAEAEQVLVVDVSNLAWRAWHAHSELATPEGLPSGHIFGVFQMVMGLIRNVLEPGKWCVVWCYDGPDAKAPRLRILPTYKAGRDPNKFNPCSDVQLALRGAIGLHVSAPEREGDDAVAWAANMVQPDPVTIYTGDKDMWQLREMPGVRIWSPNIRGYVEEQHLYRLHYSSEQLKKMPNPVPVDQAIVRSWSKVHLAKALFGDSSDSIKGVDRLRRAHVVRLLNHPEVHDPDTLYDKLTVMSVPMATATKLHVNRPVVERNWEVVQANGTGFDERSVRVRPGDAQHLREVLQHYACASLVDSVPAALTGEPVASRSAPDEEFTG
jgi:5'-3' exonuclease